MEIITGHKFYNIWGRNDLLFVNGVMGRGYLIISDKFFKFKIIYFISFFVFSYFSLKEKLTFKNEIKCLLTWYEKDHIQGKVNAYIEKSFC